MCYYLIMNIFTIYCYAATRMVIVFRTFSSAEQGTARVGYATSCVSCFSEPFTSKLTLTHATGLVH